MNSQFNAGDTAYVSGHEVLVIKQVLRHRPAYRVRFNVRHKSNQVESVVDGCFITKAPTECVFLKALNHIGSSQ